METLEGRISILAALKARVRRFQVVLVSASSHAEKVEEVLAAAAEIAVPVKRVPAEELDRMAGGVTHGGVLALCTPKPPTPLDDLLRVLRGSTAPPLLLLIEGVEDARNLGYTLRSAEALGAHGVLVKKHVWDFDGGALSRASSGAFERLPVTRLDRERDSLAELKRAGVRLWGCIARVRTSLYGADLRGPTLLAIGGEKRGLSAAVREECDDFLTIPMQGQGTSLPLSHAAAVVLAEAMRQRLAGRPDKAGAAADTDMRSTGPEEAGADEP